MRRTVTVLLVLFSMSLVMCLPQAVSEEPDAWTVDLEAARTLARKTGRPLLVYVLDEV